MLRRASISTRTETLVPYTRLVRSLADVDRIAPETPVGGAVGDRRRVGAGAETNRSRLGRLCGRRQPQSQEENGKHCGAEEMGRASSRGRVWRYVYDGEVAAYSKNKTSKE